MNVLIVEKDKASAEQFERLLKQYDPEINVFGEIQSEKVRVKWFNINFHPDLVFMDIQLASELDFEIYEQIMMNSPIVFTIDNGSEIQDVFTENTVDYLKKPIEYNSLTELIEHYKSTYFKEKSAIANPSTDTIDNVMKMLSKEYKKRFVINVDGESESVSIKDVLFFHKENKLIYLYTKNRKRYQVDYSLELLKKLINPKDFFRINESYIVSLSSIMFADDGPDDTIKVKLKLSPEPEVLVNKDKTSEFNKWLEAKTQE